VTGPVGGQSGRAGFPAHRLTMKTSLLCIIWTDRQTDRQRVYSLKYKQVYKDV